MTKKEFYRGIIAVLVGSSMMIPFIPLALTIMFLVIFTLAKSIDDVKKSEKALQQNKFIATMLLYAAIFVYICAFLWMHGLPFFFKDNMY